MKIEINIPERFEREKIWAVTTFFHDFCGLKTTITTKNRQTYLIVFPNGETLEFPDLFFANLPDNKNWYESCSLYPLSGHTTQLGQLEMSGLQFPHSVPGPGIPNHLGFDLAGSIFFWLSRWEEATNQAPKDLHGRFDCQQSVAVRLGLTEQPQLDHLVANFRKYIQSMGYQTPALPQSFRVIPTHDIDIFKPFQHPRNYAADLIKRRSVPQLQERLKARFTGWNPYDSFDRLIACNQRNNATAHFYFLHGSGHKNDLGTYRFSDPEIVSLFHKLLDANQILGFHPGYTTANAPDEWHRQKSELERNLGQTVYEGRQHFLRFHVPQTWQMWNDAHMTLDSSMILPHTPGYRCGTARTYPVFDLVNRKQLALREMPAPFMDTSLFDYQNLGQTAFSRIFRTQLTTHKSLDTPFTFLFHTERFFDNPWLWDEYEFALQQ